LSKVLLTGFSPFAGESINPSELLVKQFSHKKILNRLVLPVSYEQSFALVKSETQRHHFSDIIMLGQAGGRSKVCPERFSVNLLDSTLPDADQKVFQESKIVESGPEAYRTAFNLADWEIQAKKKSLPLSVSNSAGTYVCNYLAYQVAHHYSHLGIRSLFVHLPYLPEQTLNKQAETPSLEISQMELVLNFIFEQI